MMPTREKLTETLIEIVTKKLPSGVTEIDRAAKLDYIRPRWTIECAPGLEDQVSCWSGAWIIGRQPTPTMLAQEHL